jgi:hypothetical protein
MSACVDADLLVPGYRLTAPVPDQRGHLLAGSRAAANCPQFGDALASPHPVAATTLEKGRPPPDTGSPAWIVIDNGEVPRSA